MALPFVSQNTLSCQTIPLNVPPEFLSQMIPEVPEDFEFRCVTSYDEKERLALVADADFILFAGPVPLTGKHDGLGPELPRHPG